MGETTPVPTTLGTKATDWLPKTTLPHRSGSTFQDGFCIGFLVQAPMPHLKPLTNPKVNPTITIVIDTVVNANWPQW
jgi:hypothetical protein